jgi:large subunit ribosomal protein L31e
MSEQVQQEVKKEEEQKQLTEKQEETKKEEKKEEKKTQTKEVEKERKKSTKKEKENFEMVVNFRRVFMGRRTVRAKRAIKLIRYIVHRHFDAEKVIIDPLLARAISTNGKDKIVRKVRIAVKKVGEKTYLVRLAIKQ